ncbi:MAG: hypothetical protein ACP59X_19890 [Solidesulfovibrio sp. DCME]|uniref:hypothetical protein n=1 Tax=Solidesulfovibrio sp. DCME TaxID=3447380 RepID=UPI003D0A000B
MLLSEGLPKRPGKWLAAAGIWLALAAPSAVLADCLVLTVNYHYTKISELNQADITDPAIADYRQTLQLCAANMTDQTADIHCFSGLGESFNPGLQLPAVPGSMLGAARSQNDDLYATIIPGSQVTIERNAKDKYFRYTTYPTCPHQACITSWTYTHENKFMDTEIFDVPETRPDNVVAYLQTFFTARMDEGTRYAGTEYASYTYVDDPPEGEIVHETWAYKGYSYEATIVGVQRTVQAVPLSPVILLLQESGP